MNLILKYAIEIGASDIHITENQEGWVRAKGNLHKCGDKISLSDIDEFIELVIPGLLDDYIALRDKRRTNPIDGAFKYMFRRFRINIYRGMDGVNLAIRLLSDKILSLEELYLPKEVERFTQITGRCNNDRAKRFHRWTQSIILRMKLSYKLKARVIK